MYDSNYGNYTVLVVVAVRIGKVAKIVVVGW